MLIFLRQLLALLIATGIAAGLIYSQTPILNIQQIFLVVIIILIVFSKKLLLSSNLILKSAILFLSSLATLLIIISSGGLYSPFFVLIHIFIIGSSLILSLRVSLAFLFLSIGLLGFQVLVSDQISALFKQDPNTAILYLTSLITIVPLVQIVASHYHLKDKIAQVLTAQIKAKEFILEDLEEIIITIDKNMNIVSVNKATEVISQLSQGQILNKPLLEILDLRDSSGEKVTKKSLSIDEAINELRGRIIENYLLYQRNRTFPTRVKITIQPTKNPDTKNTQINLIIKEAKSLGDDFTHQLSANAEKRYKDIMNQLENSSTPSNASKAQFELLQMIEENINILKEIEDHPFNMNLKMVDIVQICQESVAAKQKLAKALNVNLDFIPPDDPSEKAFLNLKNSNLPNLTLGSLNSDYSTSIDPKWLGQLMNRLLDMTILLSSGIHPSKSLVTVLKQDNSTVYIKITAASPNLPIQKIDNLFKAYYPGLEYTNLKFGSGLEGLLAQTIATHLNLKINIDNNIHNPLSFEIEISRQANFT